MGEFGDQVDGAQTQSRRMPARVRAALDRRHRPAGNDCARPKGEPLEAFDIILRGGLGRDAAIGKPLLRRVPSAQVEDYVARLFAGYLEARLPEESFASFCVRTTDDDLISIAQGHRDAAAQRQVDLPRERQVEQDNMEARSRNSAHGRTGGRRSRGRPRRQGTAGSAGLGDREIRLCTGDLFELPGGGLRS